MCGFRKNTPGIVSAEKDWQYMYWYNFINAKNLFKMPDTHFKSQIYTI